MRPLDGRLLRLAAPVRPFLAATGVWAAFSVAATIVIAWGLAEGVSRAIDGQGAAVVTPPLLVAAAAGIVRAASILAQEAIGVAAAARVRRSLRTRLLQVARAGGPAWRERHGRGRLGVLLTTGLDALDPYVGKYLPQLVLTAVAVPVLLLVIARADWVSALCALLTLPLVPVFMILIGLATRTAQRRHWDALAGLSTRFLDVIEGLPTLKLFGRQSHQSAAIRDAGEEYRARTLAVLRWSFTNGLVLELAASLAVALVAVSIGLRLVSGELPLVTGLFVLVLLPDLFAPLRQLGAQYHAAADGLAAIEDVAAVLDDDAGFPRDGAPRSTTAAVSALRFRRFAPTRDGIAVCGPVTAIALAGRITAITGPSGSGKTSVVRAMLGFSAYSGVALLDRPTRPEPVLPADLAWCPQRADLPGATVRAAVALGDPIPRDDLLAKSLALAAAAHLDPDRPLGEGPPALSGGERQRLALARAYYRALRHRLPVLLLDEPTSALDDETERAIVAGMIELALGGMVVLVVSHRRAVLEAADRTITMGGATRAIEPQRAGT